MSNKTANKNDYLVTKVSIIDTMRNMPYNKQIEFDAITCGPMTSARSAATRLAQAGEGKWNVTSDTNGATYSIIRIS